MARPIKEGLEYFSIDVDFFDDDKIQFLSAAFGLKGEAIVIRLLTKIYRNSYFIIWNDDTTLLFTKRLIGDDVEVSFVSNVVKELIRRQFFDEYMYEKHSILTSKGIQKRYVKVCTDSKRKINVIKSEYDLLQSKPGFPPEETQLTPLLIRLTPEESTQSKVKESKVNKSIVEESKEQNSKVQDSRTNQTKEEESKSNVELNSKEKEVENLQNKVRKLVTHYDRDGAEYLTTDIIEKYGYKIMNDFLTECEEVSAMYENDELLLYTHFKKWIGNHKKTFSEK